MNAFVVQNDTKIIGTEEIINAINRQQAESAAQYDKVLLLLKAVMSLNENMQLLDEENLIKGLDNLLTKYKEGGG